MWLPNRWTCGTVFRLRAALAGALPAGTLTNDQLRSAGLLPHTEAALLQRDGDVVNAANGSVEFRVSDVGVGNDRDVILQAIGGSVPTATRAQQLP